MRSSLRQRAKQQILEAAACGGVFAVCRWWTRHRLRIFAYHGVADFPPRTSPRENADGFFVPADVFEAHLRTLAGHYQVLPLMRVVEHLRNRQPLPDRVAVITFDDGYANNAEVAAPLLEKYRLPATFFLTTGFIDGTHRPWWADVRSLAEQCEWSQGELVEREARLRDESELAREALLAEWMQAAGSRAECADCWRMMAWDQVRELREKGFEIAPHTVSHVSLAHETADVMDRELRDAWQRIESEVGCVTPVFAYPYGQPANIPVDGTQRLQQQGYEAAVTTVEGFNAASQDRFSLYRLNCTGNHHRHAFRALASGCRVPRVRRTERTHHAV